MKRFLLIFGVLLLILVACDEKKPDQEPDEEDGMNEETNNEDPIETDEEPAVEDEVEEEEAPKSETLVSQKDKSESSPSKNNNANSNVKDVATDIIWAQINKDYDYLKSVASEGVTVNEKNNTVVFNNKEASHTFEFLTGIEKEDLEFRFVEGEDSDRAIVGFAAIDYENEYSYVIEMILNQVNGAWKLTAMDINK